MLSIFDNAAKKMPRGAAFAHLVIDEAGKILYANREFVDLARDFTRKKLFIKGVIGKTVKEIFGKETMNTVVGTFLRKKDKRSFSDDFMIGDRLYQVVVEEVVENDQAYYEFFYFPMAESEGYSKQDILQNITYELATQKGFADTDWILTASDEHCKQLITCLINHEHTTLPAGCCPYKLRCKFNPEQGGLQLDRRAYYRTKVFLQGELYLTALKDRPVPPQIEMKKILCQAHDLSIGGIRLSLRVALPAESVVRVVFDEFTCKGTVVWTQKQGEEWLAGIRFLDVDPDQQYSIIRVVTRSRITK